MATKKEKEIIDLAVKRLKKAVDGDDHNRSAAIDDLKFANGEQWDAREKKRRSDKGRPALQINLLPKFIDQVVGDMLHNAPSVKLRPIDSRSDVNIAKIRQGIISNVEYLSNSKGIYGYAGKQMVTCGYGGWRVLTRFTEENPFLQEIYMESIRNPFLIYLDPSSKDQNYADARWGLLLEKMSVDDFEDKYPEASLPSDGFKQGKGLADEHWYDGETVTVAEYFTKEIEKVTMLQLEDGRVVTEEEFDELKKDWKKAYKKLLTTIEAGPQKPATPPMGLPASGVPPQGPQGMKPPMGQPVAGAPAQGMAPPPGQAPMGAPAPSPQGQQPPQAPPIPQIDPLMAEANKLGAEPKIVKRRETDKTVIKHRILTCMEIISGGAEGKTFPGKYIPLVLLKGKELNIEGKNYVYSLIRNAKDPQKLINYWNTAAAETIALAPKAPWLGTAKQFEGYENDYAAANVENFPFLKYNSDPEAPGPPMRQSPGQPPTAIFAQIARGEDNLKSVIGMFNADIGAPGSEQTGAAITARQKPGDIATFEFMENLARAVLFTGRIINEMIPEIYDTERDMRVRNIDDTESFVPVNTTVGNAMKTVTENPERFSGMDIPKLRSLFSKEGKDAKYNDVTAGKYDVVVTTGPSYATQRQESVQHLLQLVQSMPQQMAIAADILVESMDFKGADELATRLRKGLPPNMVKPRAGEPPQPPPQPPPQVLLAQAKLESEKAKIQLAQLKVQQETVKLEHEKVKMELDKLILQAEMQGGGKKGVPQEELADKHARLQLDAERLRLEREKFDHQKGHDGANFGHKSQIDRIKLDNERRKIDGDIATKMMQSAEPIISEVKYGSQ